MRFLLDTNVLSESRKRQPDPRVGAWFSGAEDFFLSVLVLGEVRQGVERLRRRGDDAQAQRFEDWLLGLPREFAGRVLPVSVEIADRWGRLNAVRPLPPIDGFLAATALVHDLTFATRDRAASLADTGVRLLDPWLEPPG